MPHEVFFPLTPQAALDYRSRAMKSLQVGETAPDFNALDQDRNRFFLAKAAAKEKILLVFYPADDTPVCSTQLAEYGKNIEAFKSRGIQVYGISISSNESQKEFHQKLGLPFPLLADYDTRITTKYGVMSFTGHPKRALFLIGEDRKVLWKHVEALAISYRSTEEILSQVDKLFGPPPQPTRSHTPAPESAVENSAAH